MWALDGPPLDPTALSREREHPPEGGSKLGPAGRSPLCEHLRAVKGTTTRIYTTSADHPYSITKPNGEVVVGTRTAFQPGLKKKKKKNPSNNKHRALAHTYPLAISDKGLSHRISASGASPSPTPGALIHQSLFSILLFLVSQTIF